MRVVLEEKVFPSLAESRKPSQAGAIMERSPTSHVEVSLESAMKTGICSLLLQVEVALGGNQSCKKRFK